MVDTQIKNKEQTWTFNQETTVCVPCATRSQHSYMTLWTNVTVLYIGTLHNYAKHISLCNLRPIRNYFNHNPNLILKVTSWGFFLLVVVLGLPSKASCGFQIQKGKVSGEK